VHSTVADIVRDVGTPSIVGNKHSRFSDRRWHASQIIGIISKEHVADSVADSIKPFG
jgi:hypothetical protein